MKIFIERSFSKDVDKIKDKKLLQSINSIIIELENFKTLKEVIHLKKIKGYSSFFRIRVGDYRMGIEEMPGGGLNLVRFLHRKEIYRYFPNK